MCQQCDLVRNPIRDGQPMQFGQYGLDMVSSPGARLASNAKIK